MKIFGILILSAVCSTAFAQNIPEPTLNLRLEHCTSSLGSSGAFEAPTIKGVHVHVPQIHIKCEKEFYNLAFQASQATANAVCKKLGFGPSTGYTEIFSAGDKYLIGDESGDITMKENDGGVRTIFDLECSR